MVLSGIVNRIIFQNEENGYTVIDFYTDDGVFTAVGFFPSVTEGEALTLVGEFKDNAKFGEQFTVSEVTFDAPTDKNGILMYLSSGLFKGVGPTTAAAIVGKFGVRSLEIIENAPEQLATVRGISKKKAEEIAKSYREHIEMQSVIIFLQTHGVTMKQSLKIYAAYGDEAINKVTENPYRLVDDVEGVGFLTADKIAEKVGVNKDSDFRVMAGVSYVLQDAAGRNGHTCLPEDVLIRTAAQLLDSDTQRVESCIPTMIFTNKINAYIVKNKDDGTVARFIASSVNYTTENAIAAKLIRLIRDAHTIEMDVEKEIEQYEERNKIFLHKTQKEAITFAVNSGVMVVTGGPGTGKTTIIKCIIDILTARGKNVLLCAPTGRAAKRMSEATGKEASTIHRLLCMEFQNGKFIFKKNELSPLEADVVIVDEISMADIFIFNALLKALSSGTRLVLVGDKDQLPSVSCGNILADVISSGALPVICLTEIYRQEADSLIILNAHKINSGEMPEINNRSKDFFLDVKTSAGEIAGDAVEMVATRIPRHFGIPSSDIQVLAPLKRGVAGVENLNKLLQKELNPTGKEVNVGDVIFRVGDKVMQAVNDYDIAWEKSFGLKEEGEGVFNGDIGYIKDVSKAGEILVEFEDGKRVVYSKDNRDELIPAYAVSVHKSQGSEFSAVILALSSSSGMLLNRNLLYTAVTRAKNLVVIVGERQTVAKMVANNYTAKRHTLLKEFLWDNLEKMKSLLSD